MTMTKQARRRERRRTGLSARQQRKREHLRKFAIRIQRRLHLMGFTELAKGVPVR